MAMEILEGYDLIQRISKNHYIMRSQRHERIIHHVEKCENSDVWKCDCTDFHYRLTRKKDKDCIHITCCMIAHGTRPEPKVKRAEHPKICPRCRYDSISKNGTHINKTNNVKKQKYKCPQCKYQFRESKDTIAMSHSDPIIIAEVLNLVTIGVSYRNIARSMKISRGVSITYGTVLNWIKKFTEIIKDYTDSFYPELGSAWCVDETILRVKNTKPIKGKGFSVWLWNIIDPQTRYVIATEVSKKRSKEDATKIIASGRKRITKDPNYVITDCLAGYEEPIRKEFKNRVAHIKTKSIAEGFVNRPVERYHGEIKANTNARRGLGNDRSAQSYADFLRINHNFVKPHMGLNGKTPAEAAKIDLHLGENKFLDLIIQATAKKTDAIKKEYDIIPQLGKRIQYVEIVNEKDSIRIVQKEWIKKYIWREINDILSIKGFAWLSNGNDSCWIKEIKS